MRIDSVLFSSAASEAKYLAMPASMSQRSPRSKACAASSVSSRAARARVAISPIFSAIAWCSMIGLHAVVLEDQLARIDRVVAELLELAADREARPLGRDEQAHARVARARLGVGLDQQREARALDAVRNPGLGAVDDVVALVAPRRHADRLQVGAGIGLGQRQATPHLAR